MGGFLYNRRGMPKVQHLKEVIRMAKSEEDVSGNKRKSKSYPPTKSEIIFTRTIAIVFGITLLYISTRMLTRFSTEFKNQAFIFAVVLTLGMTLLGIVTERHERNKEKRK